MIQVVEVEEHEQERQCCHSTVEIVEHVSVATPLVTWLFAVTGGVRRKS